MTNRPTVHAMPTPSSTFCFLTGSFELSRQPQIWISCLKDCRQVPKDKILIRRTRRGLACQLNSPGALSSASGCSDVKGVNFSPGSRHLGFISNCVAAPMVNTLIQGEGTTWSDVPHSIFKCLDEKQNSACAFAWVEVNSRDEEQPPSSSSCWPRWTLLNKYLQSDWMPKHALSLCNSVTLGENCAITNFILENSR